MMILFSVKYEYWGVSLAHHQKEDRAEGHLFSTALFYRAVQGLRRKLKLQVINTGWLSLREIFSGQQRVAATFTQKNGRSRWCSCLSV